MQPLKAFIALGAILIALISDATAQTNQEKLPEIVHNDGYAFSWKEKDKLTVYDVVSAWNSRHAQVADCAKHSTKLKGVTWCFANDANLKKFIAKTDKNGDNEYLPFVGGRCALGASWNRLKAKGDPRTARIVQADLGPVLVLQSHQKWWATFKYERFARMGQAEMYLNFATRLGDVVPNDSIK